MPLIIEMMYATSIGAPAQSDQSTLVANIMYGPETVLLANREGMIRYAHADQGLRGRICYKKNVKKIAFGNKEHTTDKKMGVSVLLRLFISSNEVCNTAYAF